MKKFLDLCLTALVAALMIVAAGAGINACSEHGLGSYIIKGPVADEMGIEMSVENYLNPPLCSVDEAIAYQVVRNTVESKDSMFMKMSEDAIRKVASVLLKNNSTTTYGEIVSEYLSNRNIYDNTPPSAVETKDPEEKPVASLSIVQEGTTKVTEAPQTRVSETTTSVKDTTIDGKKATITTTIEKHE